MIAFTLLFGAISLMVVSMGMDGEINENSFFWDHFEFFKTAFLMMIAFYFGDSSLKTLSKRWNKSGGGKSTGDESAQDDADYEEETGGFGREYGDAVPDADLTEYKKTLQEDSGESNK